MQYSRLWFVTSAKDPRKLSYFNEGSMFDRTAASNPSGFVVRDRPFYHFFGPGKEGSAAGQQGGHRRRKPKAGLGH